MTYVIGGGSDPNAGGAGGYVIGGGGQQKKPGWGWNPLTDITQGASSLGSWVDQRTHLGGLNPGIGSALATITNIIPGLANLAVKTGENAYTGLAHGDWQPLKTEGQQVGGAFLHGAEDTIADVATIGGLAPYTAALEQGMGSLPGHYKPSSLLEYATKPGGEGLLGGVVNDALNLTLVADGAGGLARLGQVGKAAEVARTLGESVGQKAAVDAGATAADIEAAGKVGREAHIQQSANEAATATGGDPAAIADRIRARAGLLDTIEQTKQGVSNALAPWRALRPLGRAAADLRGATPVEGLDLSQSLTGASEGKVAAPPVKEGFTRLYRGSDQPELPGQNGSWWSTKEPEGRAGYEHWQYTDVPKDSATRLLESSRADAVREGVGSTPVLGKDVYLDPTNPAMARWLEEAKAHAPAEAQPGFVSEQAKAYAQQHGLPEPKAVDTEAKVDPVRGRMIAELYARAKSNPSDPKVVASYTAFARDVVKQWQFLKQQGVNVDFVDRVGNGAYANEGELFQDVQGGHLTVDRTGADEAHLMPQMNAVIDHDPAGNPITVNDAFRAVHDYFGHTDASNLFDRHGEDVAWRLHQQMFSDAAKPALFTETVGQNSYLNFLPENVEMKRSGLSPSFPEQKATLLPELVQQPDWRPAGPGVAENIAGGLPRPEGVPEAYKTFADRSKPVPRWAKAVVDRLPEPMVKLLSYTDDLRLRHSYTVMQRQSVRALAVEARRIENLPEIQAARQAAEDLVAQRIKGVTPSVASDIVGERIYAAITFGPLWEHLEQLRPEVDQHAPGLIDHVLHFSSDVPPEVNTPEFRAEMAKLAEPIVELRRQAFNRLKASAFLGDRGLDFNPDAPTLTAKEARTLAQAEGLINQATLLEKETVPKELAAQQREIAKTLDQRGALVNAAQLAQETGEAALDQIDRSRTYVPADFRDPARMAAVFDEMAGKILDEGGATRNPHTGEYLETGSAQGYLVGAAKSTAARIILTGDPLVDRAAISEALDGVARAYQNAYQFPDMMVGAWIDDGIAHIDPTQFLAGQSARDQALILAAAREQATMMELHSGDIIPQQYDPNLAVNFLAKHAGRDARAGELRRVVDTQAAQYRQLMQDQMHEGPNGELTGPDLPPPMTQSDVDAHMAFLDTQAVMQSRLHPEQFKTPDDWYRQSFKSQYARRASTSELALNEIRPMIQNPSFLKKIVRSAIKSGSDEGRWYYVAHDYIEKSGQQIGPVELGMDTPWSKPKVIDGRELLYDMLAIHSMNTDPAQNFIWGLGSIRNWVNVNQSSMSELVDAVKEWVELPKEKRTPLENPQAGTKAVLPKLVTLLGKDTNQLARRYMLAVLDGHTIDTWDADFFRPDGDFTNYGNVSKQSLSLRNVPQELIDRLGLDQAVMEWHGSNAAAKIRSFRDNLADPENSMSVTLDSWMARLFGPGDTFWGTTGRWSHYADMIRGVASDLSNEVGRKVMPHEVQAALWFWIKNQYADVNSAAIRGMGIETMRQIGNGSWTRELDPLGQFWSENEQTARRASVKGEEPAPLRTMTTTKAKELGPETVEPGAALPETQQVERNWRLTRSTQAGRMTEDGNSMVLAHQEYQGVMDQIEKHLAAGEEDEARYAIWDYVRKSDEEWNARKEGLQFWDAPKRAKWPEFSQTLADTLGLHVGSPLNEEFAGEVLGQFLPRTASSAALIRLFQSANFTTLFHETGHLIRSITTGDDLAMLERQYGVKRGVWTREAEEAFVHDMISASTGIADSPARPALDRLRQTLAELYEPFGQTHDASTVHPEIANFWGHLLAPELTRIEEGNLPGLEVTPGTKLIGYEGQLPRNEAMTMTPEQRVARTPKLTGPDTPAGMYQRGVQGQEALDQWRSALIRKREAQAAAARATEHVNNLEKAINDRMLPSQLAAAGLRGKAVALVDKVYEGVEDPSMRRTPPAWQPLVKAGRDLAAAVEQYPELENILATIPDTFGKAFDYATEQGFSPTQMPELTPARVRQLVNGTVRLGGEPGKEFVSGGRQVRSGALRAAELNDMSIESIIAGLNHAVQEDRTNLVIDWIDRVASQEIPRGDNGLRTVPRDSVAWDPIRRGMLSTEKPGTGDMQALGATRMIPRTVANALREYSSPTSNPFFRAMAKVTDPWRAAMLTWNPQFYQRHFIGHVVLAAMNEGGLNFRDWLKALDAARHGFKDLPEVTGMNIVQSEIGQPGVVRWPSIGDAYAQGGPRAASHFIADKLHGAITTSDSFARAVVYFSDIRKGATPMEAMQHSMDALVDYGDLSNTERYFARALIPFYSFSKGVLKVTTRMPFDHPLAAAITLKIGQWQGEQAVDDQGNPLPERYQSVVNIGGHKVDFRSYSPFKDVAALTTPEGLVNSLQFAVKAVIESGLGIAPPGVKAGTKVDQYGRVVPDVKLGPALIGAATSTPQGQLFQGLSGNLTKSPATTALNFFGLPVVPDSTIDKAGARNTLSTAEVAAAPKALQEKAAAFSVDTNVLQNNLSKALGAGTIGNANPLSLPQGSATTPQIQTVLSAAQDKQQAASQLTRATTPRTAHVHRSGRGGGGGGHKVRLTAAHIKVSSGTSHRRRSTRMRLRQGFGKTTRSGANGLFRKRSV